MEIVSLYDSETSNSPKPIIHPKRDNNKKKQKNVRDAFDRATTNKLNERPGPHRYEI